VLLTGKAAWADCTPAAADNVTATCTGATTNKGGGLPGSTTGNDGYGTGVETGVTVNVVGGASNTVSGNTSGIFLGDATVTNNAGASITGGLFGIFTNLGSANVTNSGSIAGTGFAGIVALTNATVTNNAGASIAGAFDGIAAASGFANVTNSGSITGTSGDGISANTDATVTNSAAGSIAGANNGINAVNGSANVANSGSIVGTNGVGISASTNATVTNNAGASITGGVAGILANGGFADVINSGRITGTLVAGIGAIINATVTNNAGGSIAGGLVGILALGGGSSVFNAGTISGGTAAIQFGGTGNTLTLAPGSVISGAVIGTGNDVFQLGGTGAATFDVSSLGPAAQYQGFGTFNKLDSSVWTLTGTSTFAGPVNVNGGTLAVNGDITSVSGVMVNAGALAGSGVVGNTQINAGGIFAPGNGTPGSSMTVAGNLAFQSGAIYLVQLNAASASFANVSGTAALAGTVRVVNPTNSYRFNANDTLLTSAGLNNTRFDGLAGLPAGISGSFAYTSNTVTLNLTSSLGQLAGLNANQRAVGAGLDAAFNAQGSSARLGAIFSGNIPQNLTQASGETATGSQQTTFNAMNQFMGVMTDSFVAGRGAGGSVPGGATGYADAQPLGYAQARKPNDALAAIYTKAPQFVPFTSSWSVWAAGFGGSQTTDGNTTAGSNNTSSSIYGSAVGADYRFSPDTLAGFALAGGGTNFSVANGGSGRSDLFQAGAFVRHNAGAAYISAALAYGWQDVTTDRIVTVAGADHLRAEFNANAWSGRIEGGYRFVAPVIGGVGLTPYIAAQVTTFDLPAYAESALSGATRLRLPMVRRTSLTPGANSACAPTNPSRCRTPS
jgi:uncharacterized protein with beta-barrel porin domain